MKRITIILIILGVVGLVAFRLISNKQKINANNQVKEGQVKVAVNIAKAENRLSENNLTMVGTVNPEQVIDIKSEVAGKVTSLNIELGDHVKKGQVLAHIDNTIRALGVDNAQQALADAKTNLERYTNLYNGGAATKAQLEQYQMAYENAQNQLTQARKELSNTTITAPISGIVTNKMIESGAFVNVAMPIATVVDVSELKVNLKVPEKDVYLLKEGDTVIISTSVFPGELFEGKITFVSPKGDEAHNYPVEVSLKNRSDKQLKAGTYVDVAFNEKGNVPTLQIPREALTGSIQDAKVFVVGDNNIARLRPITVGKDNGSWLEVRSGLKEGDRVVTTGQINLTDSTEVSIIQ